MRRLNAATAMLLVFAFLAPAMIAGCGKSVGDTIDDATITTRVKTALLNDPVVGGLRIDVDTFKGHVSLSGRVKSADEEAKAMQLARQTPGVVDVKSTLIIEP